MGDGSAAPWIQSIIALNPRGASAVRAYQGWESAQAANERERRLAQAEAAREGRATEEFGLRKEEFGLRKTESEQRAEEGRRRRAAFMEATSPIYETTVGPDTTRYDRPRRGAQTREPMPVPPRRGVTAPPERPQPTYPAALDPYHEQPASEITTVQQPPYEERPPSVLSTIPGTSEPAWLQQPTRAVGGSGEYPRRTPRMLGPATIPSAPQALAPPSLPAPAVFGAPPADLPHVGAADVHEQLIPGEPVTTGRQPSPDEMLKRLLTHLGDVPVGDINALRQLQVAETPEQAVVAADATFQDVTAWVRGLPDDYKRDPGIRAALDGMSGALRAQRARAPGASAAVAAAHGRLQTAYQSKVASAQRGQSFQATQEYRTMLIERHRAELAEKRAHGGLTAAQWLTHLRGRLSQLTRELAMLRRAGQDEKDITFVEREAEMQAYITSLKEAEAGGTPPAAPAAPATSDLGGKPVAPAAGPPPATPPAADAEAAIRSKLGLPPRTP